MPRITISIAHLCALLPFASRAVRLSDDGDSLPGTYDEHRSRRNHLLRNASCGSCRRDRLTAFSPCLRILTIAWLTGLRYPSPIFLARIERRRRRFSSRHAIIYDRVVRRRSTHNVTIFAFGRDLYAPATHALPSAPTLFSLCLCLLTSPLTFPCCFLRRRSYAILVDINGVLAHHHCLYCYHRRAITCRRALSSSLSFFSYHSLRAYVTLC